jgi:hypothetical protein
VSGEREQFTKILPAVHWKVVKDLVDLRAAEERNHAREELSMLIRNAAEEEVLAVVPVLNP